MESAVIKHSIHKHKVCNICQDAELYESNLNGVCTPCLESRVADGVWSIAQAYDKELRTDADGSIIIKKC